MGANMCFCEDSNKIITKDLKIDNSIIHNYSYKDISPLTNSSRVLKSPSVHRKTNSVYLNIEIDQIIPEQKLHTKNDNEILFIGELELINSCKNANSFLFCSLTRMSFSMYENKLLFISMKKANQVIPLENITTVDLGKCNDEMFFVINYSNVLSSQDTTFGLSTLKFKTKNREMLFKWVVVLNYFVQKRSMKNFKA